jgi:hypothetical protein
LPEPNLVALVPTPFGGVPSVLAVDSGLEEDFLEWHNRILVSRQEKGNLGFAPFYQTRQDFATTHRPLAEGVCRSVPVIPVGPHPDLAALKVT